MNTFLSAMIFHLEASAPSSLETCSVSCSKLLSCNLMSPSGDNKTLVSVAITCLLVVKNRYLPCRSTNLCYNPFTVNQYVPYIYNYMRVIASMAGSSDTVKSQRTATEVSGGGGEIITIGSEKENPALLGTSAGGDVRAATSLLRQSNGTSNVITIFHSNQHPQKNRKVKPY